jgi:hypothetical protein
LDSVRQIKALGIPLEMSSPEKQTAPDVRELTPAEVQQLRDLGETMVRQGGLSRFITDAERAEVLALYRKPRTLRSEGKRQ